MTHLLYLLRRWIMALSDACTITLFTVANIRLRLKLLSDTNTQDYYGTELIADLLFFMIQATANSA